MSAPLDKNRTAWQHIFDAIRPVVETDEEAERLTRAVHPVVRAIRSQARDTCSHVGHVGLGGACRCVAAETVLAGGAL